MLPLLFLIIELVVFRHSPQLAAFKAICVLIVLIPVQNVIKAGKHGGSVKDAPYFKCQADF